ncbi:DoxX family protein [Catellatospora sichuanensis]|uniref:DoxX family protein n=1 Tax=Catellatospora sichuanensis TaxID=1969805 RepID=UPI001181F52E|nr:DoxX family protein [Catellatospora sichuanensis]
MPVVIGSILLALLFGALGVMQVVAAPPAVARARHLGVPPLLDRIVGGLAIAGAVGLLIGLAVGPVGIAAAGGLVLLMIGALGYHLRAGDRGNDLMAPVAVGLIAAGLGTLHVLAY